MDKVHDKVYSLTNKVLMINSRKYWVPLSVTHTRPQIHKTLNALADSCILYHCKLREKTASTQITM